MARPRRNISENHRLAAFFPNLRRCAKPVKEYLRRHGHEWTFYDSLDWHEGMHLHEGEVRIVDAEIYAHRFALHQCLDRQYYVSLQCYVEGLAKMAESGSSEKKVYHALRDCGLIDECRAAQESAWWKVLRTLTPTPEDLAMLAPLAELSR